MDTNSALKLEQLDFERLQASIGVRSLIVNALLSDEKIPAGAVVYASNREDFDQTYRGGIAYYTWYSIDEGLRLAAADPANTDDRIAVCTQFRVLSEQHRKDFRKKVANCAHKPIGLSHITMKQIEVAYRKVQAEIVNEIEPENSREKYLPKAVVDGMKNGTILVVEDVELYLENNLEGYFLEVWGTSPTALKHMDRSAVDDLMHRSIKYVQRKFDTAQQRFLALLHLPTASEINIETLDVKINARKRDAIGYITHILQQVSELQQGIDELECIDLLGFMDDLKTKTIWELIQIIFYTQKYAVGPKRRHWAQTILVQTELAHSIHENPQWAKAEEVAGRINNTLNVHALKGREGIEIKDVFVDSRGNYYREAAIGRRPVKGMFALEIKPRVDVLCADGQRRNLFPKGLLVRCSSRVKKLHSIMGKCWDGGYKVEDLNDLVGIEFDILPEQFIEEYCLANDGALPSPEWLEARVAQAAIELEYYLYDALRIDKSDLTEDPIHQLGTQKSGSTTNGATSKNFRLNKFVFRQSGVKVEAQIKNFNDYLRAISKDSSESHDRYERDRIAINRLLELLFPTEIWPGFADSLRDALNKNKKKSPEAISILTEEDEAQ